MVGIPINVPAVLAGASSIQLERNSSVPDREEPLFKDDHAVKLNLKSIDYQTISKSKTVLRLSKREDGSPTKTNVTLRTYLSKESKQMTEEESKHYKEFTNIY